MYEVYFSATDSPLLFFIFLYKLLIISTYDDFISTVSWMGYLLGLILLVLRIQNFCFIGMIFGNRDRLQIVINGDQNEGIKHLTFRMGEKLSNDIINLISMFHGKIKRDIIIDKIFETNQSCSNIFVETFRVLNSLA